MLYRFPRLITILALSAITSIFATKVTSQELDSRPPVAVDVIRPGSSISLNDLINKAFWENSGNFFEQASIPAQFDFLFGWTAFPEGSYSENNVIRDGMLLNAIKEDYFHQLAEREPNIRTRDLDNPFNTSVKQNPAYLRD
jgi:hypothetical protein